MTTVTLIKIILSFFVGGGVVTFVTWAAQKLGSRIGGVIAGFPTTIAVSLLFLGLTKSVESSVAACSATLMTLSMFGVFCVAYTHLSFLGFKKALGGSVLIWLAAAAPVMAIGVQNIGTAIVLFLVISGLSRWALNYVSMTINPSRLPDERPRWGYGLRFVMGGGIVAFAVLMSVVAGNVVGGVFAAFPATTVSSIVILNYVAGCAFTADFVKSVFASALINCGVYTLTTYFAYAAFGIFWGTLIALAVTLGSATLVKMYPEWRAGQ